MPSDSDIQPLFTGTVYRSRINDISNMSDSDALAGGRFTIAELNTQYKDVVELDRIQSRTFDADSDGVISGFTDFSNTINRMDENHWLQIDSDGYGNNMLGDELDFRPERPGREQPPIYSIGVSNFKASPAIVDGIAENRILGFGAVVSADATVVGDGDREMDGTGALTASQSVVDGLLERAVKSISANLQAQPSMVDGLTERGVDGSGTFVSSASFVVGTAEDEHNVEEANLVSTESIVEGDAEREIRTSAALVSTSSIVDGLSEREIRTSVTLLSTESIVDGLAENKISGSGTLTSTASIVVGSGQDTFLGNGDLVSTASIVEGIAVRSDPYVYMAGTEYVEMTETVYVLDVT